MVSSKIIADKENNTNNFSRKQISEEYMPGNSAPDKRLDLTRSIGNQSVQSLFRSGEIQAKLKISEPNDIYEQEADRVADEVMRMPVGDAAALVQREVDEEEEIVQAKQDSRRTQSTSDIECSITSLKGGGQPLDANTRAFFEPRFGHDFSQVRVHTNSNAADAASSINARAFAYGNDIVFGAGQYSSNSDDGKRLIGHELTHVVQQTKTELQANGLMMRQIKETFTEEEFAPVREAFYANKRGREQARESCIAIVNTGLRALFMDKKMKLGSTMEETMSRLRAMSFADAPIEIGFLDKRGRPTQGTIEPVSLEESVRARILSMTGDEPLIYMFGMSIMDGYHSVLLAVDNYFVPEPKAIYWMDQIYSGYDLIDNDLDGRITRLTILWWKKEAEGSGKSHKKIRMNTTVRIWPIIVRLRGDYPAPTGEHPA